MRSFLENMRFIQALPPAADRFAGTVYPAGIDLSSFGRVAFVLIKGVGTTGTSTVTVVAGDNASPQNETAIPFTYRRIAAGIPGAVIKATASGFVTTAGSEDMYVVEVNSQALAASGYKYAHLKLVESVDDPVIGSVLAIAGEPRYADSVDNITD